MQGFRGELGAEEAIGRYRIVLPLGQGGTADVYLAVAVGPSGFHKLVVLKALRKCFSDDPDFRAMFLSEARLAARLHHPNIVQTNEVIEVDGVPTLVMEYLDGQPLSQVIVRGRQGGFSLAMQLRVLVDALAGLHRAHELTDFDGTPLSVVHRDVSPHNLFVTVEGQAKVLDFGIAKLERSMVETEVGTVKGKLRYMAPEQIAGAKVDRRADIYAAGVVLWEAVVGERMWRNCPEDEIRARVRAGDVPMPATVRPDVSPSLDRICRKALALRPDDRYATAQELADDIERALHDIENGVAVTHRDIGATVARLFADVRAETKMAIERKLGRASLTAIPIFTEPARTPSAGTLATAAGEAPAAPAPADAPRPRRRRVLLGVTGGAAIAAFVLALVAWQSGVLSRGAAREAVALPAPPPPASLDVARIAKPSTPVPVATPAERRAVAPPAALAGRADRDGRPRSARTASKRAESPAVADVPVAAPAAEAPAPAADCTPPFFVDADGIKRFRPECM